MGEKYDASRLKGPRDLATVEAGLFMKDGSYETYEFRVTSDYYNTLEVGSPIEIVYDRSSPSVPTLCMAKIRLSGLPS